MYARAVCKLDLLPAFLKIQYKRLRVMIVFVRKNHEAPHLPATVRILDPLEGTHTDASSSTANNLTSEP